MEKVVFGPNLKQQTQKIINKRPFSQLIVIQIRSGCIELVDGRTNKFRRESMVCIQMSAYSANSLRVLVWSKRPMTGRRKMRGDSAMATLAGKRTSGAGDGKRASEIDSFKMYTCWHRTSAPCIHTAHITWIWLIYYAHYGRNETLNPVPFSRLDMHTGIRHV